ncbi:acyltransferase family protein [Rhodococcus pyridinivorans]
MNSHEVAQEASWRVASVRPTDRTKRIAWPDAAKGLCMVLVVLGHSALWFDQQVQGNSTLWLTITDVFAPFRMPFFFLISGLFSVNALARPLQQSRKRTIGLLWVYVLWTILFVARLFVPGASDGDNPPTAVEFLQSVLLPTPFWYLWALPVYFLFTWLIFRVLSGRYRLVVLIPLVALSAVAPLIDAATDSIMREPLDPLKLGSVASNALWFYLGACAPSLWYALMKNARWSYLAGSLGLYCVLIVPVLAWGVRDESKILLAPLALFICSQAFSLLSMRTRVMSFLQWVGRSTLSVYVLHMFAISVISALVGRFGLADLLTRYGWVEQLTPIVMSLTLVVVCIWVGNNVVLAHRYTSWMLEAPRTLTGARERR